MTEPGQTYNYSLSDHIKAIKRHIGEGIIDYCIYDTGEITPEYIRRYNMQGSELVEQDIQRAKAEGVKLLKRDLATIDDGCIRHNPNAIAEAIIDIVMLLLIRVFVNAKFPKIKKKEKSVSDDSVQQADTSSQPTSSESSNDSNETP